jgi:hypothetical protein
MQCLVLVNTCELRQKFRPSRAAGSYVRSGG